MKKSKKFLTAIIALSLSVAAGVGVGISAIAEEITANKREKQAVSLIEGDLLMDSTATVTLGATQLLRATVNSEIVRCAWTTSDASILTIEGNGNIVAHQLGTATVTAKYGDQTAECAVTVALNNNLPSFEFDSVDGEEVQIDMAHTLGLGGIVRFNGIAYEDVEVSYKLSGDKNLGTIENGIFTPAKEGTATITATASWRGVDSEFLTKKIQVTVVPSTVLYVNDEPIFSDVEVYTVDSWKGKSYKNVQAFKPTLFVNGEKVTPNVSILHTDIAEYDEVNGEIVGYMHGQTTAVISYQDATVDFEETVPVTVSAPVGTWEAKVEYFSALKGELIDVNGTNLLDEAFSGDNTMLLAYQGEKALDISTGKVLGVETSGKGVTNTRLTIYGKKYAYDINVSGYTMVIATPADVVSAFRYDMNGKSVRDGYYYLKNDVDMTNYDVNGDGNTGDHVYSDSINVATSFSMGEANPFRGIFDGNGKAIKGMKLGGGYGMFGVLDRATVKDLALVDINMFGQHGALFGFSGYFSTIENVYISINFKNDDPTLQAQAAANPEMWLGRTTRFGLFGHRPATNSVNSITLRDVIVEMSDGFTERVGKEAGTIGMFSNDPFNPNGTVQPNFTNVYFLVPTASNGRITPMCQADKLYVGARICQTVYAKNQYTDIADGTTISFDAQHNPVVDPNGDTKLYHYAGALHYDDIAAMKAAEITQVGSWKINENNQFVFAK